ncbi:MAG: UDP-N-acetylmuramoyl-L-alanine--D-glutamate ligase [Bacteroidales bacterium]|nr:UDP-N-acetylmuramoyl-L-alanine--D-glutamate ligase [Bacteroidales bacterium]
MNWNNFQFTETFNHVRILIAGFGKEGISTYHFLTKYCKPKNIFITDDNPSITKGFNIPYIPFSEFSNISSNIDLIIKSPGYPLRQLHVFPPEKITSQTDLFLRWFHSKTIGITGTKGKSTISSLIYHIINGNGKSVLLAGNIGIPVFDLFEKDEPEWVVLELSANQLEIIHRSPHIALLNNIYEEHLDYFGSFESYAKAKSNILLYQSSMDYALIHYSLKNFSVVPMIQSNLLAYGYPCCFSSTPGIALDEKNFIFYNNLLSKKIIPFQKDIIPLVGKHNLENISGALLACHLVGISFETAIESIYTFKPLPHRLEKVGTFRGITFINDSISTIPQATIHALTSLHNVHTLILGGYDRGIDYHILIDYFLQYPNQPATIILLGQVGIKLQEYFKKFMIPQSYYFANNMEEAVKLAYEHTPAGKVCLLSPAASSYDQFKNFEDRGNQFKEWCIKLM